MAHARRRSAPRRRRNPSTGFDITLVIGVLAVAGVGYYFYQKSATAAATTLAAGTTTTTGLGF